MIIYTLFGVLDKAFTVYYFMLIGYILLSWIPAAQGSAIGRLLQMCCEPYLSIFRRIIPPIGMIDISALVGIFALSFIQNGLFIVIDKLLTLF